MNETPGKPSAQAIARIMGEEPVDFKSSGNRPLLIATEIERKFQELVGLSLESQKVADLEGKLKAIESVKNVASLIRELELES